MKTTKLLLLFTVFPAVYFAQSPSHTQSNGVVVHHAPGVPAEQPAPLVPVPVRTVEDWNLAECIEALSEVDFKIGSLEDTPEDAERRQRYQAYKARIIERRDSLTNSAH